MLDIVLSHHPKAKRMTYGSGAGTVTVTSRSGLNFTEKVLLEQSESWSGGAKVLVVENRTAVLGLSYKYLFPESEILQHSQDDFYHQKLQGIIERQVDLEGELTLSCSPDLPGEMGGVNEAFLQVSQSLSAEMTAEYLQQIHQRLCLGGRLWLGVEKQHRSAAAQVKKVFGSVTEKRYRFGCVLVAKKKEELKKVKQYQCEFELPLGEAGCLSIKTRPGVFSHRRADGGALALLDVVRIAEHDRVFEMGCGSGLVSLGLQKRTPSCQLFLLDSNTRAVECAQLNAASNGCPEPQVECSSRGWPREETFDVFIGNPPYFGDHQISGLFIDTAAQRLVSGGMMWLVAKSMDWNVEHAKSDFEICELIARRGYVVMKARRR